MAYSLQEALYRKEFRLLYRVSFLSADIKTALSDVKPALMSAVEEEFKRNPYEVCHISSPLFLYIRTLEFILQAPSCSNYLKNYKIMHQASWSIRTSPIF
jgi:hypothetical protein